MLTAFHGVGRILIHPCNGLLQKPKSLAHGRESLIMCVTIAVLERRGGNVHGFGVPTLWTVPALNVDAQVRMAFALIQETGTQFCKAKPLRALISPRLLPPTRNHFVNSWRTSMQTQDSLWYSCIKFQSWDRLPLSAERNQIDRAHFGKCWREAVLQQS